MSCFLSLFSRMRAVSPPPIETVRLSQEIPSMPQEIVACISDYAYGTTADEEVCKQLISTREFTVAPKEKETCIAFQIMQRTQVAVVKVLPSAAKSAEITKDIPRLQALIVTEPIHLSHHESLKQFQQIKYLRTHPFNLKAQELKELLGSFPAIERIELIEPEDRGNNEYLEGVDASSSAFKWINYILPILSQLFQDMPSLIYIRWNDQAAFPSHQRAFLPETLKQLARQLPMQADKRIVQSVQIPANNRYTPLEF